MWIYTLEIRRPNDMPEWRRYVSTYTTDEDWARQWLEDCRSAYRHRSEEFRVVRQWSEPWKVMDW